MDAHDEFGGEERRRANMMSRQSKETTGEDRKDCVGQIQI